MIITVLKEVGCMALITGAGCLLWFVGAALTNAQTTPKRRKKRVCGSSAGKSSKARQYVNSAINGMRRATKVMAAMPLSLRATQLTPEQLSEVVKSRRPGAGMPYHDRSAYTDKCCYGYTREEMSKDMPPAGNERGRVYVSCAKHEIAAIGVSPEYPR